MSVLAPRVTRFARDGRAASAFDAIARADRPGEAAPAYLPLNSGFRFSAKAATASV